MFSLDFLLKPTVGFASATSGVSIEGNAGLHCVSVTLLPHKFFLARQRHIQSEDQFPGQEGAHPHPRLSSSGPAGRHLPGKVPALWDGAQGPPGGGAPLGRRCGQVTLHHPRFVVRSRREIHQQQPVDISNSGDLDF